MIINQVVQGGGGSAPAHYIEKTVDANGKLTSNSSSIIDLTGVTDVGNYVLAYSEYENTSVTGAVSFGSVTTISGQYACNYMFNGCTGITSIDVSGITTITGTYAFSYTFRNCTGITTLVFNSLSKLTGDYALRYMCQGCSNLQSISFPSLTSSSFGTYPNPFNNMLYGCSGVAVHFPSNLQSVIGSWSDVTAGFGGTNTTVLFDLPATE